MLQAVVVAYFALPLFGGWASTLDIKQEGNYIAVLNYVVLAF